MADDFQAICKRIGIDVTLPINNTSQHQFYRSYYDKRLRDLVGERLATDISMFDYTF